MSDIEDARALKRAHPEWLLVGERHARRLPGFDCGNSPTELQGHDLEGRTLVHTTHAGTQGLVNAVSAAEVITGALVNAGAIVRYIQGRSPEEVTIVRMGHEARERCDEDDLCAELLAARLEGNALPSIDVQARLREAASARKFFDPAADWAPEQDFFLCTQLDRFDFVLQLDRAQSPPRLRRVDVP